MSSVNKVGVAMRKVGWLLGLALWLVACGSEEPRTQITLMIDADPGVKADVNNARVSFSSGPIGSAPEDLVARPPQDFPGPLSWPLVLVLVPAGDDPNRAFRIEVAGRDGANIVVEASARSHFIKGKHLALRMHLYDACRNAVFGSCDDDETCSAEGGTATCSDNTIDPTTLPPFDGVGPSSDAGIDANDSQVGMPREIVGRVFSTNGLLPLSNATVSLTSGASVETDTDGTFTLSGDSADRVITIQHPDHALAIKPLPAAASVYLEVFMKQVDARQTLSAVIGGSVQSGNGAAAVFPGAAFKRPNGDTETGTAEVTLASPDTKDGAQAQAFPGDFKATAAGGKEGAFAAVAAIDVTATAGGMKLNLTNNVEAEISLPVKSPGNAQTLDLWSFDPAQRTWRKEGTAALTQDATGKPVYRAKITHLSWWAVGTLVEDTSCMHLCATFNAAPAAFARATVTGIDAPFQGSFFADDSGCVAFDAPPSTQVSVVVQSIDGVAAPRVVITPSTLGDSTDISTCGNLGTIPLSARGQSSACPGNWMVCNGVCTDLSSSAAHCGACTNATCAVGENCVNGTCGCTNNETMCGTQCINTASDRNHCGACDAPCGATQQCLQGRCVEVACPSPTTNCSGICVDLARDGVGGQCPTMSMPECVVPADCQADEMCDDTGACVPLASCATDDECPSAYRCNDMTFVCDVPDCGMVGYAYCRGGVGCVNLRNDATNCGACGRACSSGQSCDNAACVDCPDPSCIAVGATCGVLSNGCGLSVDCGTCNAGETCGGGGVPNQCGATGNCGDGTVSGNEGCDDGNQQANDGCTPTCQVESGYTCPVSGGPCMMQTDPCNGLDDDADSFTDESFAPNNCGTNTGECVSGVTACIAGMVQCTGAIAPVAETCDGLDNDCNGTVDNGIDLQNDVNNCGSCGNACNFVHGTGSCAAGSCVLASCDLPYYDNCDGNPSNGCEADLNSDQNNCSVCGYTCFPSTCSSGFCN